MGLAVFQFQTGDMVFKSEFKCCDSLDLKSTVLVCQNVRLYGAGIFKFGLAHYRSIAPCFSGFYFQTSNMSVKKGLQVYEK